MPQNTPPGERRKKYQETIKSNYSSYLRRNPKVKYPVVNGKVAEGYNCINGVCHLIEGTGATDLERMYTGNMTFNDNREKEGYYQVDPVNDGFEIGDVVQHAKKKGDLNSRFTGKVTPRNQDDLIPSHASIIVDSYNKNGTKWYKVVDNTGEENFRTREYTEQELMGMTNGMAGYDGLIVNRYDPDKIEEIQLERIRNNKILQGENEHAPLYESRTPKFTYTSAGDATADKTLQQLTDIYNKNYQQLGKMSDLPPEILEQLLIKQIGIAGVETEYGKDQGLVKNMIPNFLLDEARKAQDALPGTKDDWMADYWKKNANNVQSKYPSEAAFKQEIASRGPNLAPETKEWLHYNTPRSKGTFQQKDLSTRGRFLGVDLNGDLEQQALASAALSIDNYHRLKKVHPSLTPEELIDLTVQMHNAPSKALTPEFVNYYGKNNDMDYVNRVNAKVKGHIQFNTPAVEATPLPQPVKTNAAPKIQQKVPVQKTQPTQPIQKTVTPAQTQALQNYLKQFEQVELPNNKYGGCLDCQKKALKKYSFGGFLQDAGTFAKNAGATFLNAQIAANPLVSGFVDKPLKVEGEGWEKFNAGAAGFMSGMNNAIPLAGKLDDSIRGVRGKTDPYLKDKENAHIYSGMSGIGTTVGGAAMQAAGGGLTPQSLIGLKYGGKLCKRMEDGGEAPISLKALDGRIDSITDGVFIAKGKSHTKGGIKGDTDGDGAPDIEFEGEEGIFKQEDGSLYMVNKDIFKKYLPQFKNLQNDPISRATRKRLMANATQENEVLRQAKEQEAMAQQPQFAMGGPVDPNNPGNSIYLTADQYKHYYPERYLRATEGVASPPAAYEFAIGDSGVSSINPVQLRADRTMQELTPDNKLFQIMPPTGKIGQAPTVEAPTPVINTMMGQAKNTTYKYGGKLPKYLVGGPPFGNLANLDIPPMLKFKGANILDGAGIGSPDFNSGLTNPGTYGNVIPQDPTYAKGTSRIAGMTADMYSNMLGQAYEANNGTLPDGLGDGIIGAKTTDYWNKNRDAIMQYGNKPEGIPTLVGTEGIDNAFYKANHPSAPNSSPDASGLPSQAVPGSGGRFSNIMKDIKGTYGSVVENLKGNPYDFSKMTMGEKIGLGASVADSAYQFHLANQNKPDLVGNPYERAGINSINTINETQNTHKNQLEDMAAHSMAALKTDVNNNTRSDSVRRANLQSGFAGNQRNLNSAFLDADRQFGQMKSQAQMQRDQLVGQGQMYMETTNTQEKDAFLQGKSDASRNLVNNAMGVANMENSRFTRGMQGQALNNMSPYFVTSNDGTIQYKGPEMPDWRIQALVSQGVLTKEQAELIKKGKKKED